MPLWYFDSGWERHLAHLSQSIEAIWSGFDGMILIRSVFNLISCGWWMRTCSCYMVDAESPQEKQLDAENPIDMIKFLISLLSCHCSNTIKMTQVVCHAWMTLVLKELSPRQQNASKCFIQYNLFEKIYSLYRPCVLHKRCLTAFMEMESKDKHLFAYPRQLDLSIYIVLMVVII